MLILVTCSVPGESTSLVDAAWFLKWQCQFVANYLHMMYSEMHIPR